MRMLLLVAVVFVLAGCAEPPSFAPEPLPATADAAAEPAGGDAAWATQPCDRIGATTVDGAVEAVPFQQMAPDLQAWFLSQHRDDPLTGDVHEEDRWTGCMGPGCPDDAVTVRATERGEVTHAHASTFHAEPIESSRWDEHDLRRELEDFAEALELDSDDLDTTVQSKGGWSQLIATTTAGPSEVRETGIVVSDGSPGFVGEQTNPDWPQQRITLVRGVFDIPDKTYMAEADAVAIARADVSCLTARADGDRPALRIEQDYGGSLQVQGDSMAWRVRMLLTTGHDADCRSEPERDEWNWSAAALIDAQTGALHDVEFETWDPCIVY